ncbi:MAG: acyl-ACP--UDP-N-acetylglucosamine O-acyltransferase [Acidobacteriota bacterium]
MKSEIHPTAVIDPAADIAAGVRIGPHAVVGPHVEIGEGTEIGSGAVLEGPLRLGRGNRVFAHVCLGFDPQDLKYRGERTTLEIGDRNQFREFCTVHRGTASGGGVTRIGSDGLFMVYTHIAHDAIVGDRVIFANNATLAGHVEVGDEATLGAFAAVHQFCRIGKYAYIGGVSVITQDALPFVKTVGQKPATYGINRIGLERRGFDEERLRNLERAVRILTRERLSTSSALERLRAEFPGDGDVSHLVEFIAASERGVIKSVPGAQGSRGGAADGA